MVVGVLILKLADDAEDVVLTHDEVHIAFDFDFRAAVFDDGKVIPFTVKKGDKVLISKYGGTEIKIDGDMFLIMREDDILGIIG